MRNLMLILPCLMIISCSSGPSAQQIIDRSISFHDPGGHWDSYAGTLSFEETRPGGPDRNTRIWIDNSRSFFRINRNGTEVHGMAGDSCFVEMGEADCERVSTMRNYYTYLWGLPMKLKDPGTQPDADVQVVSLHGRQVYRVEVPYEKDTWHFYFSKNTYELLAYDFIKKDGSGEYIIPEGVYSAGGMRLLNNRSWYTLDSTLIGKDRLVSDGDF